MKNSWPLSARDVLFVVQGYKAPDGSTYMFGKPCTHPKCPAKQKVARVDSWFAYHLKPLNNRADT